LSNVVERAVYRWENDGPVDAIEIDPFASPFRPQGGPGGGPGKAPAADAPVADRPVPEDSPVAACDAGPSDFKSRVASFERELLARALAEHRFNQRATAEALGLSYDQLRHALRRHELINATGS
jgi:psp operon transcriptional activator